MPRHQQGDARRTEIIAACEAELDNPCGLHDLADYVLEYLDDIVNLLQRSSDQSAGPDSWSDLQVVGRSLAAIRSRIELEQLTRHPRASVLISGERGTGRRHFARMLHFATCPDGALLELDASNLGQLDVFQDGLAVAGSHADATIYVHELGEAAPSVQLAVARLLGKSVPTVRVIASSSALFAHVARRSNVRQALAFRFEGELQLEPLRDHREDVPLLARHFADRISSSIPGGSLRFSGAALDLLRSYPWPGNVAELERLVRRIWNQSIPGIGSEPRAAASHGPSSGAAVLMQLREQLAGALRA